MPKAIKYYSDEELEQKLKELENLKAQREKEKKELLDRAKIAYMDKLIADKKNDSQFNQAMNQRIVKMIEGLTSRKDKETKKLSSLRSQLSTKFRRAYPEGGLCHFLRWEVFLL